MMYLLRALRALETHWFGDLLAAVFLMVGLYAMALIGWTAS